MPDWIGTVLRIALGALDFLKQRHIAANTQAMVDAANAKGQQVSTDEIEKLINTAHYDPDPKKRQAALEEIERRNAVV